VIATRTRTLGAAPEDVWRVVADPASLARWWPLTERVEGVDEDAWTTVHRSPKGRVIRADWRLDEQEPERRRAWTQDLDGSPFGRILSERRVEVRLGDAQGGTAVTLELRQRGRGWARFGGLMLRRAAGKELDQALAGLERVLP
jgi:uncharacterized protein YndB with AHSA1/START domain